MALGSRDFMRRGAVQVDQFEGAYGAHSACSGRACFGKVTTRWISGGTLNLRRSVIVGSPHAAADGAGLQRADTADCDWELLALRLHQFDGAGLHGGSPSLLRWVALGFPTAPVEPGRLLLLLYERLGSPAVITAADGRSVAFARVGSLRRVHAVTSTVSAGSSAACRAHGRVSEGSSCMKGSSWGGGSSSNGGKEAGRGVDGSEHANARFFFRSCVEGPIIRSSLSAALRRNAAEEDNHKQPPLVGTCVWGFRCVVKLEGSEQYESNAIF